MLCALTTLVAAQTQGTQMVMDSVVHFLNHCTTHPNSVLWCHKSGMILHTHSDASYLTEPQARSRVGGYHYFGNKLGKPDPPNQAPVLPITAVMKNVVSSAAEAEIGGTYKNCKEAVILRNTAADLGHPQTTTPVQVDNSTADNFANNKLKQQRSRAIDMRFYWVQDRVKQGQFHIYWAPGSINLADYYTKHFSAADHRRLRGKYLTLKPDNT